MYVDTYMQGKTPRQDEEKVFCFKRHEEIINFLLTELSCTGINGHTNLRFRCGEEQMVFPRKRGGFGDGKHSPTFRIFPSTFKIMFFLLRNYFQYSFLISDILLILFKLFQSSFVSLIFFSFSAKPHKWNSLIRFDGFSKNVERSIKKWICGKILIFMAFLILRISFIYDGSKTTEKMYCMGCWCDEHIYRLLFCFFGF